MNTLSADQQSAILRALVEGNSVRATCRITGAAKGTVLSLLRNVGAHCKNYHDRHVAGLTTRRVECDEIWSFCEKKARRVPVEERGQGVGDVWTWTALDADSKLIIGYRIGNRDLPNARAFVSDLCDRLANRVQLTTDGFRPYLMAVEEAFKWNGVDFAQLYKIYGPAPDGVRRYSPPECIGIEKHRIMGNPDIAKVSTSFVERQNLTMRMQIRRYTRLTNAFSKKVEYHLYATALHFMYYNYCRPHQTLTKAAKVSTTPAMAAGLATRVWEMSDLVNLLHSN